MTRKALPILGRLMGTLRLVISALLVTFKANALWRHGEHVLKLAGMNRMALGALALEKGLMSMARGLHCVFVTRKTQTVWDILQRYAS